MILRLQKYNFFFFCNIFSEKNSKVLNPSRLFCLKPSFSYLCSLNQLTHNTMQLLTLLRIGWGELLIIALIVLLLFGAAKIPALMKSMGKGVKNFKDGMNGVEEPEIKEDKVNKE